MKNFPKNLADKLAHRKHSNALRELPRPGFRIDFASNDYLGFSQSKAIFEQTHQFLIDHNFTQNGATGSRLISGNHPLYELTENQIAQFHQTESALIFNSGYDANVGFFSSVPQKGDIILYDELCHASIRDGIRLSHAKSYKFAHNDLEDLERLLAQNRPTTIYVATESVFSMDGDSPNLEALVDLAEKHGAYLVIDEAHALGVFGDNGEGLVQSLGIQDKVFARIMTFGKGLGSHGATILGSEELKNYLVNFARSLIYTTGLSPHAIATIHIGYQELQANATARERLREHINFFNQQKQLLGLKPLFVRSKSAIQCAIIPGNEKVKSIANSLQEQGSEIKPILSPTVPEGQERLRICLHSYNTIEQISALLNALQKLL
ncbi:8-amino-7-oxononanoate synthase [Flavobacterium sp. CYK-4]|uniref:aminotransferase class I/II-fold pyridoxal phosphate-dependent enzyme n=1 Tax=Flavobacterium lotistagni TaxID=2709660 RepID=UPI00140D79E0|nr:8-amino-7-oxononanoate synthase [Flavobacterium lotistagni]NHM06591.1 8-amino-7-oxononanoate synthase [Flavobacterium lotistagni]